MAMIDPADALFLSVVGAALLVLNLLWLTALLQTLGFA